MSGWLIALALWGVGAFLVLAFVGAASRLSKPRPKR